MDRLPDETTILKFHHFLKRHGLGKVLFQEVNKYLEKNGLMLREGSIVDATIISAPSSTKNTQRLHLLAAFSNLLISEKYLWE